VDFPEKVPLGKLPIYLRMLDITWKEGGNIVDDLLLDLLSSLSSSSKSLSEKDRPFSKEVSDLAIFGYNFVDEST
jgi:hypothetical protein